ncbi:hypothetical protein EsH8_VII_000028 [Colletotrichum jinshuiense]
MYISPTTQADDPKIGVLYLTDAFGIPLLQNKLLADSFARAGFTTVMPDIFRGDPAPHDITFDAAEFLAKHTTNVTDPVIETTIRYMREELAFDRIAVTGYCFGGRYAFRFLQEGRGADIGFAAHPSFLQDSEVLAISGPASIAAAEIDTLFEPARRFEVEGMLNQTGQPYQVALYSGTFHGFGTRANISIPEQNRPASGEARENGSKLRAGGRTRFYGANSRGSHDTSLNSSKEATVTETTVVTPQSATLSIQDDGDTEPGHELIKINVLLSDDATMEDPSFNFTWGLDDSLETGSPVKARYRHSAADQAHKEGMAQKGKTTAVSEQLRSRVIELSKDIIAAAGTLDLDVCHARVIDECVTTVIRAALRAIKADEQENNGDM